MTNSADKSWEAQPVRRTLTVFSNATDELVAEYDLLNFNLAEFKQHFKADEDPLMYYGHEVRKEDVNFISPYLAEQIMFDFDKYAYIVDATAINTGGDATNQGSNS
jgi:hypothetical protein